MRMTQRKKQMTSSPKPAKKGGWGAEPAEPDDEDETPTPAPGPDPDVVAQRASDLGSDKTTLQKIEAELAEKRKSVEAERAKLVPLEQEAEKLRKAIHRGHAQIIADNIDTLLLIVPEHERTSCSDEDPSNEGRCARCNLLYIKKNPWDAASFKFDVSVVQVGR